MAPLATGTPRPNSWPGTSGYDVSRGIVRAPSDTGPPSRDVTRKGRVFRMLTVSDLTREQSVLRVVASRTSVDEATVERVVLCDGHWEPIQQGQLKNSVLICQGPAPTRDSNAWRRWLRGVAQRGAVAIVVARLAREEIPAELITASGRHPLALLVPTTSRSAVEVRAELLERQVLALNSKAGQSAALLHEVGRLHRQGEGVEPLLSILGKQVGGRVRLLSGHGGDWGDLSEHAGKLDDIAAGRAHSAKLLDAEPPLLLHPVGRETPYEVLAAERPEGWPQHLAALIKESVGPLDLLNQPLALRAREKRLEQSAAMVRVNVLQDLMAGKVTQAAPAIASLLPGFLADEESAADGGVEVAVLQCAPDEEQIKAAAEVEAALGWQALVVPGPTWHAHIIILLPSATGQAAQLGELLRPVVARVARRALGVSQPVPWVRTARGYTCAAHALATAVPGEYKIAVHDGSAVTLARELPDEAWYWAAALLDRPKLTALPETERRRLYDLTQLALTFGPTQAARLLGVDPGPEAVAETERAAVMPALDEHWSAALARLLESEDQPTHRNTVSRYRDMLMEAVGLHPERLADRAVMSLALQLSSLPEPVSEPLTTPKLKNLFTASGPVQWADERLARLTEEQQDYLATWLDCEADTKLCATRLGLHRNTLSKELKRCGGAISRPLLPPLDATKSEAHRQDSNVLDDVYFALAIKNSRRGCAAPDPVSEQTAPEQHSPSSMLNGPPGYGSRAAGVYDAFLSVGGKNAYASDQNLKDLVHEAFPTATCAADENRSYVRRSTQWLAEVAGIHQFADIGCGLPMEASPNVHEIVQRIHSDTRTVYIDNDLTVLNLMEVMTKNNTQGRVHILHGDVREPETILARLSEILDMTEPVAVLLNAVLHFIEGDPRDLVQRLLRELPPGSAVSITYATTAFDAVTPPKVAAIYQEAGHQVSTVTHEEFRALFGDLELADPGAVGVHRWRPDDSDSSGLRDEEVNIMCAVGLVR